MKNINNGQSLVEVVVAIGIVALVVTGMVVLMTTVLGTKTKGFDRKKAVEMSEIVMEQIVSARNNNPGNFWDLINGYWSTVGGVNNVSKTMEPNYPKDYSYIPSYNSIVNERCTLGSCIEAVVIVRGIGQSAVFTRLFTKY